MKKFTYKSPLGNILIEEENHYLQKVIFCSDCGQFNDSSSLIENCVTQLSAYFNKKLDTFDLPLNHNGTSFQREVWNYVKEIPRGETRSYKNIAHHMNNLGAIRAIGAANGANPFHIIIPCHRVIGSDGSLTGYAGGIDVKKGLLELEGIFINKQTSLF